MFITKCILHLSTFLTLFFALPLSAAVSLRTETTNKVYESTKLIKSVTLIEDNNTETAMSAVSFGLRKKAVFGLVPVNVYVVQLLAAKPEKLIRKPDSFLASLKESGPIQMHFTFLRNIPGEKISSSFKDGLEANNIKVSTSTKELSTLLLELEKISEFKEGESFSLTFHWNATGTATVYMTDPKLQVRFISGPSTFADELLSIWFGKPADSKLAELKTTLITK